MLCVAGVISYFTRDGCQEKKGRKLVGAFVQSVPKQYESEASTKMFLFQMILR